MGIKNVVMTGMEPLKTGFLLVKKGVVKFKQLGLIQKFYTDLRTAVSKPPYKARPM